LQFNYNATGNRAYGTSIISPLLKTLENQLNIERISTTIFQRKANAVWHVKLGGESGDMVFQPTQNDLDSMRSSLEDMRENQEWVTNQFCNIKVLDSQGKVMDPSNLLQFNQNQLIFGLEVPIVLMGIGNVPEGLALAQSKAFEKRVESIQQSIEAVLESQLFRRILNSQGIDEKVEFEWVSPSKEDRYKEIEVLKGLLNLAGPSQMSAFGSAPGEPLLAPDVRQQIIDRIMELMELEPSAEQAKEAEMEAPQPKVPPMEHMHQQLFESRESDNMSVHEWVGFDFKKYKENIDKFIDSQQFLEREFVTFKYLPGTQQKEWIELVANYNLAEILTEPKAEKLREILKKAFNENWSIREIAKQIENKVKPGTMDVKMPNGSEITVSNTVRALTIARVETMRAANQGALLSYAEQGVEEVSWSAALDERSCDYCDEHDGLIMSVEDADERLPAHVNCRCSPTPVIREKFATPKNR
jgi:SPP1 gp7 family putative phage head morphogenesis protein